MPPFSAAIWLGFHAAGLIRHNWRTILRAVGFEFDSGVEHEHARAAREERLRARDARRAGTDDAVHGGQ